MSALMDFVMAYCSRLCGRFSANAVFGPNSKSSSVGYILFSFVGSFLGILLLSKIDRVFLLEKTDLIMIVGSFGAQAVLIFAQPAAPLAQPYNCIIGNAFSSFIGVSVHKLTIAIVGEDNFEANMWIAAAFAVSLAIVVMLLTKSTHPPGGASALIAVTGSQRVLDAGYLYVLFPCVIGSIFQVSLGILINNIGSNDNLIAARKYPMYWLPSFEVNDDTNSNKKAAIQAVVLDQSITIKAKPTSDYEMVEKIDNDITEL